MRDQFKAFKQQRASQATNPSSAKGAETPTAPEGNLFKTIQAIRHRLKGYQKQLALKLVFSNEELLEGFGANTKLPDPAAPKQKSRSSFHHKSSASGIT